MNTRVLKIYTTDFTLVRRHCRVKPIVVETHMEPTGKNRFDYETWQVERIITTRKEKALRITFYKKAPSPWFMVDDLEYTTIKKFIDEWKSGKTLSNMMLT